MWSHVPEWIKVRPRIIAGEYGSVAGDLLIHQEEVITMDYSELAGRMPTGEQWIEVPSLSMVLFLREMFEKQQVYG